MPRLSFPSPWHGWGQCLCPESRRGHKQISSPISLYKCFWGQPRFLNLPKWLNCFPIFVDISLLELTKIGDFQLRNPSPELPRDFIIPGSKSVQEDQKFLLSIEKFTQILRFYPWLRTKWRVALWKNQTFFDKDAERTKDLGSKHQGFIKGLFCQLTIRMFFHPCLSAWAYEPITYNFKVALRCHEIFIHSESPSMNQVEEKFTYFGGCKV